MLICVTFSFPLGVGGWPRLLLVAFPGLSVYLFSSPVSYSIGRHPSSVCPSVIFNRVHTRQGNLIFSWSGNCQGISWSVRDRWNLVKMSGNFTFQSCKSLDVWSWCTFLAQFIKFLALISSGKLEIKWGKIRGIVRELCSALWVGTLFKRHLLWSHEADSRHISHIASIGRGNE